MSLLSWNDQYSVNIKKIDEQHKILINLINDLHDAMKQGKGKDVMGSILDELANYTVHHFAYEEKLFVEKNYPLTKQHKLEHDKLVSEVSNLQKSFKNGETIMTMEVLSFLKKWLNDHIIGSDKKYTAHLNAQGIF